jgi:hypothetical protein
MNINRHIAAIALSMTLLGGLVSTSVAGAAGTSYTLGGITGCTEFSQNTTGATNPNIPQAFLGLTEDSPKALYGLITVHRPTYVANYTGTTELYWDAAVYELNSAGQWAGIGTVDGAYATIFLHSGNQLTSIYWGQELPGAGKQITVSNPEGHRFLVVGETYWWTGSHWYEYDRTTLGACQF